MCDSSKIEQDKLLEALMTSFESTKRVQVNYIDVSEITKTIHKLTFDDIKKIIIYPADDSFVDVFRIQLPMIDEETFIKFKEVNALPVAGYLIKLKSNVIEKAYGLLTVEITSYETHINESDNRYLKDRMTFQEVTNFIYDFDKNVYVQVPEKALTTTRFKLQKKGLQMNQIENENVKEFLMREQKLTKALSVLKPLSFEKQQQVLSLSNGEGILKSKSKLHRFFQGWQDFLSNEVWIHLKFIYSQITWEELLLLRDKSKELLKKVKLAIKELSILQEDLSNMNSLDEDYESFKIIEEVKKELDGSLYRRGFGSRDSGYFIVKDSVSGDYKIVENFKEIEKRNMLAKEKYTEETIEKEKKSILERWNRKRG